MQAARTPRATERLATVSLHGTARSAEPRPTTPSLGRTADPLAFGLQARSTTISRSAERWRIRASFMTPATDALYGNTNPGPSSGTSGTTRPKFTGVNGSKVSDNTSGGGITWFCIKAKPGIWQASHVYQTIGSLSNNDVNCS